MLSENNTLPVLCRGYDHFSSNRSRIYSGYTTATITISFLGCVLSLKVDSAICYCYSYSTFSSKHIPKLSEINQKSTFQPAHWLTPHAMLYNMSNCILTSHESGPLMRQTHPVIGLPLRAVYCRKSPFSVPPSWWNPDTLKPICHLPCRGCHAQGVAATPHSKPLKASGQSHRVIWQQWMSSGDWRCWGWFRPCSPWHEHQSSGETLEQVAPWSYCFAWHF